jgi:chromosome segregation protein
MLVKNFKSFGGQIKLNFQPGFNVITGPNGSGKSNIIDAVQFVLGELASKRMRVLDFSGLIYDGAGEQDQNKPQISQVTLYFDNTDRGLASDRSQVSIGRKVDREGKSDYYLNGKRTSRKAVLDLLHLAGITPGGYNIVQQGTATRLSDLTSTERMDSLEDLIGIKEYDEKKAEAKGRLVEAERKIDVSAARIDEVRKRVNELERQRNDALRYNHLLNEEKRLTAVKLSHQITQLEEKLSVLMEQMREREVEATKLEDEKTQLREEREAARNRIEEFNHEAAERGNTRLPMLKADLVSRQTLCTGLENRLREIDARRDQLGNLIAEKEREIKDTEDEIAERRKSLESLQVSEGELIGQLEINRRELENYTQTITDVRESAGENQRRGEELAESLIPMQESLSGIEIEINNHKTNITTIEDKVTDLDGRKLEYGKTVENLQSKLGEYASLKSQEAGRLEEMLGNIEDQIKRQRDLRSTIENANNLAKEAETTITEFSAKRDLWRHIVVEERALERIREIGEAGALMGYHGPLRSLIKIDLPNQRAVYSAAEGWINAVVVDNIATVLDCVDRLKKTKLGMTKFIPMEQLGKPEPLPDIAEDGVVGPLTQLIRCEEVYIPVVHLVWGDTYLVKDNSAALKIVAEGYRAVTVFGDVYEPSGGIKGGFYRRPPDYSKLIPAEESIDSLSQTIKDLRQKLKTRIVDLKSSGGNLRGFNSFMESSTETMAKIDVEVADTKERIERIQKTITQADEAITKNKAEADRLKGLIIALEERKQRILQQIEENKREISRLREFKPSDVTDLEIKSASLSRFVSEQQEQLNKVQNENAVQRSYIERILTLRFTEASEQRRGMFEEIKALDDEQIQSNQRLVEVNQEIEAVESNLDIVSTEVEATSKVLDQHQKTLRMVNQRMEDLERRREAEDKRINQLKLDIERLKIQSQQRLEELAANGYENKIDIAGVELERVEIRLQLVRQEKNSLGAINQLALENYDEFMNNYKNQSTRINELEEEKASILKFIEQVDKDKTDHFMAAFNEVCENYSSLFSRVTGGGDGRLELQKPEDPFSGGVDLYLQFPGKPMRLGSGASGGERSVAAIAYLLAIQRFLKAPFYLFDEIDAHLDDINISRLAEVLKDNSNEAQFLMVSLKDVMVHKADRIYGVFAQGGRSRVLALPMKGPQKVEETAP